MPEWSLANGNRFMFDNASLVLSGPDSFDFLQAQLTSDLAKVTTGAAPALTAWCNPKGRVICLFRVRQSDEGVWRLTLPALLADPASQRLIMYRFRSKVDIDRDAAGAEDLGVAANDSEDEWRRSLIVSGIPYVDSAQSERFTPHMLNLDLLGAVDFDKGCYPGQEIVARTHFRGVSKRRLRRFSAASGHNPGDKVQMAGRDAGEIVNALGGELLAVVPVDGSEFSVAGELLTPETLPYGEDSPD